MNCPACAAAVAENTNFCPICGISLGRGEPGQIQLPGHPDHLPGQVTRRQPGPHISRQQAPLIMINRTQPSSHSNIIP